MSALVHDRDLCARARHIVTRRTPQARRTVRSRRQRALLASFDGGTTPALARESRRQAGG